MIDADRMLLDELLYLYPDTDTVWQGLVLHSYIPQTPQS